MPQHVELSISNTAVESSLDRWGATVDDAAEPSLVIDEQKIVVAVSASLEDLLGLEADAAVNRPLLDDVLHLLDFGDGNAPEPAEVAKTPPLLALSSGRLARGLMRVRCASGPRTFDAIATPLLDAGKVVGSLTFFSAV